MLESATATVEALRAGAADSDLTALEAAFGGSLPADLVESLKIHNGSPSIDRYALLPVRSIMTLLKSPTGSPSAPDESHKVKAVAWSKGWLPFAQDSGGNMFCIAWILEMPVSQVR